MDTTDPARMGRKEIEALDRWMAEPWTVVLTDPKRVAKQRHRTQDDGPFPPDYRTRLWIALEHLLSFCHNAILDWMVEESLWQWPRIGPADKTVKNRTWFRDAMARLEGDDRWQTVVVRFATAWYFMMAERPKELRLTDADDVDIEGMVHIVQHPKGEKAYGKPGQPVDMFDEFLPYLEDFLASREKRLGLLGLDPSSVKPIAPTRTGGYYSPKAWNSMRYRVYKDHGIQGDYRNLRKSSLAEFKELVKKKGYKDKAVAEAIAVRGRHSVAVSIREYVDEDRDRVRDVVRSPPVAHTDDPLVKTTPVPA